MDAGGRLARKAWNALDAAVRDIGPDVTDDTVQASMQLFAHLHPEPVWQETARDVAYGEHPRQVLDVFYPKQKAPQAAVVFLHGGAFIAGDKKRLDMPFHDNVGAWAANTGRLGITANYRLAPEATWPSGIADLRQMIAWCLSPQGGDVRRVHLIGSSSGAVHAATYLTGGPGVERPDTQPTSAVMISGIYDFPSFGLARLEPYFVETQLMQEFGLAQRLAHTDVPVLYAVGEHDSPEAHHQFLYALQRSADVRRTLPPMHRARAANDFTAVHSIGTKFDDLGPVMEEFLDEVESDHDG